MSEEGFPEMVTCDMVVGLFQNKKEGENVLTKNPDNYNIWQCQELEHTWNIYEILRTIISDAPQVISCIW